MAAIKTLFFNFNLERILSWLSSRNLELQGFQSGRLTWCKARFENCALASTNKVHNGIYDVRFGMLILILIANDL